MDGDIVQKMSGCLDQGQRPVPVRKGGGEKFDVLVRGKHQFCGFADKGSPFLNCFRSQFMPAPVLVADAPVPDVVWFGIAVGHPLASELAHIQVAVFHPVAHLFHRAGSGVGADERLASYLPAPFDELVGAESVGILHLPGFVEDGLPVGTDPVVPMVGGHETSTGPSDDRNLEFLHGLDDIGTETVLVGKRIPGTEYAPVNLPVEMLDKLSEQHRTELGLVRSLFDKGHVLRRRRPHGQKQRQ